MCSSVPGDSRFLSGPAARSSRLLTRQGRQSLERGSAYALRMMDRHPDGSLRIELMDGNAVRLSASTDGRTRLSIFGPGGGHHATIRLTEDELHGVIAALATSSTKGGPAHGYRDAMTP
jgi:hypothetical protein